MGKCRETALRLLKAGFHPVVIYPPGVDLPGRKEPSKGKEPMGKGWGLDRPTVEQIAKRFDRYPNAGVGIALGPGKGPDGQWLVDVEIDGAKGEQSRLDLFAGEISETKGWDSARGGHGLYFADADRLGSILPRLKGFKADGVGGGIGVYHLPGLPDLELRVGAPGKQFQSVIPPTLGTDGEPRKWNGTKTIAELPEAFYAFLERLAEAEKPVAKAEANGKAQQTNLDKRSMPTIDRRVIAYLGMCDPAITRQAGHNQTFKTACKVGPGFDLTPDDAFRFLMDHYNPRCDPEWSEEELRHKIEDAYANEPRRGWLLHADRNGHHVNGQPPRIAVTPDREDGAPIEDEDGPNEAGDDPHRLARIYRDDRCLHADGLTMRYWQGEWVRWNGSAYRSVLEKEIRASIGEVTKAEFDQLNLAEIEAWKRQGETNSMGKPCPKPIAKKVTEPLKTNVLGNLGTLTLVSTEGTPGQPAWIDGPGPWPAAEVLPTRNALVHLPGVIAGQPGAIVPPTPRFFSPFALDYDFDLEAPPPVNWLTFLGARPLGGHSRVKLQIWPDDPESIAALQEWMGLQLLPDTSFQKVMAFIGPRRSGKGTIARIMRTLVGPPNVAGPTLSGLATHFGLQPLIGKHTAIIDDAHLSGRTDAAIIVERLLSISGEGALTIDRKNQVAWTGRLPTRFTIISNELPRLSDAAGALPGRLIFLKFTQSFYGKEDRGLTDLLATELPGILLWAIEGWERLRDRGHFIQPTAGREMVEDMENLSSPVGAFLKDECRIAPGAEVECGELFNAWKQWCERRNREHVGTADVFGRDLRAALPHLKTSNPRHRHGKRVRFFLGVRLATEAEQLEGVEEG